MHLRVILDLLEALEHKVRLTNLYSVEELNDESEAIYHHVSEDDFGRAFTVATMSPEAASGKLTLRGDMTVMQAFVDFADRDQKALVREKMKNFDANRIVVVDGQSVVDGNHHLIAAVRLGRPVRFIDLGEFRSD